MFVIVTVEVRGVCRLSCKPLSDSLHRYIKGDYEQLLKLILGRVTSFLHKIQY